MGGHSHDLVEDLNMGQNLIISKETGAPTVITQAGRDGNCYGILNVEFNNDGEIIKAENIVKSTENLTRNEKMQKEFNKILGEAEIIGKIGKTAPMPKDNMKEENPHATFVADILREKYKTDISFVSAGSARGAFMNGDISTRDVGEIFPFKDNATIINVTEKELVEAMKYSATSVGKDDGKPGLAQVSGMKYSVSKDGELISLFVQDKNGRDRLIDINNPDENKTYSMTVPSFIAKGLDGYTMLNKMDSPDTQVKNDIFKDLIIEHIKNSKEDIEIQKDGRIEVFE